MTILATYEQFRPAVALKARLIEVYRGDAELATLLFPDWSPSVGVGDLRIYGADAHLPEKSEWREALPRVLVETVGYPHPFEQEPDDITEPQRGPVVAILRTIVPKEREDHGERIHARLARLTLSTPLSDVRIIAANISVDGLDEGPHEIPAFNGALEFTSRYRSPLVGVLKV